MRVTWKIGGEAGFGIMTTGVMFSRLAARHGYHIFDYVEYPSLIRGGHNVYEVCVGDDEVTSQERQINFLFALNKDTIDLHSHEFKTGGLLAYDNEQIKLDPKDITANIELYPIPFVRLNKEAGAMKVMENNVALGASAALFSMELEILNQLIVDTFQKKGEKVIAANTAAAKVGYDYVQSNPPKNFQVKLPKRQQNGKLMVISGNEAVVCGAIAAGCKFYAAYPMTPTSSALHFMAEIGKNFGVVVKHAEDEISVINMATGAGYAGVRAMVGTSGGGFSLMTEGLGLAGITETPLVILMGQRPGPATGMPTWTGQADLQFLIHASQDEFPRIVLAPGDMTEAFYLTAHAFNLAERYQTPVFVLTDKFLAEGHQSVPFFDTSTINIDRGKLLSWDEGNTTENYLRYQVTDDGIPKRALPGMKQAVFTANSYEHNEYGFSTEDAKERVAQVQRRNRKLNTYSQQIPEQKLYGDTTCELTLVGWGSTKGPVLEAMKRLKKQGFVKTVNFLHINHVWPLPVESLKKQLMGAQKLLLLEGNSQAQMGALLREQIGYQIKDKYLKYDGRPFYPDDIVKRVKEILK